MEVTTPPRCSTGVSCDFGGVTIQSYPVVLCIRVSGYVLSLVLVGVLGIRETMGDLAIRNAKKIRFRRLLRRFRFHSILLTLSPGCQRTYFAIPNQFMEVRHASQYCAGGFSKVHDPDGGAIFRLDTAVGNFFFT